MAIYVKNKEGVMETYKIVGLKGENGVTPNIQVGTVTTLEPGEKATVVNSGTKENPVFDFGIPKGEKGGTGTGGGSNSGASIDDSTISKNKTWSSAKIEDYVLTNVGTIWKDIIGGQTAIDSTMDGFLREVEILGNTTQDQSNLSDIKHLGVWNEQKQGYEIEITVSNNSNKDAPNYKSHKTTILTPCQLMKVGNISDRLYWDKNKGRYIVEKNIKTTNIPTIENITSSWIENDKGARCSFDCLDKKFKEWQKAFSGIPSLESFNGTYGAYMLIPDLISILHYSNYWLNGSIKKGKLFSINRNNPNTENESITLLFRDTNCTDVEQMNNWVMSFSGKVAYYRLTTPESIETNITEELKLPTYINNTYISVVGGIEGSIKAKAPVDGGKVITNLQRENIELKATNEVQDELINTTMLATDEMYMMLEPLLAEVVNLNGRDSGGSPIMNMYVAMIQRGIKTIESVPVSIRDCVAEILNNKDGKQDIE